MFQFLHFLLILYCVYKLWQHPECRRALHKSKTLPQSTPAPAAKNDERSIDEGTNAADKLKEE
ncbi:hypothetical protein T11_2649 [Trichinella zimbabwensis]|uniref:Uncharacterized protein n=1 Tax=Trichinella zimbabwensis TaxID=268475 RepID=A0A0V1GWW5_9BILA|nr:hypothetical protein T11_2649 [Trichinella zimbabwensis]